MGLVVSLALIGFAGAILLGGADPDLGYVIASEALAWILLVTGLIGSALSLVFWSSWGGFRSRRIDARKGRRARMFALGLAVTSLIAFMAIDLFYALGYETVLVLAAGYVLAGVAIAIPFAGAVVTSRTERWKPLVRASVVGIAAVVAIWVLLVAA